MSKYLSDGELSTTSKPAGVNVVKVSKDGKHINNFITTRTAAVQQDTDDSLHLPIERKYLKRLSKEREKRQLQSQLSKHLSAIRRQGETPQSVYSESVLKSVLQSLVHLVRPTEHVRFLTTLRAATVNDAIIEPENFNIEKSQLKGSDAAEAMSELFVAVVSNSQSGIEESAIMVLKQEPVNESHAGKYGDVPTDAESSKKASLELLPDTPMEIISVASKLYRKSEKSQDTAAEKQEAEIGSRLRRSKTRSKRKTRDRKQRVAKLDVLCLLQIMPDTRIRLNGEGQVMLISKGSSVQIDTVNVRSMWGFVMALQRARHLALEGNLYSQKLSHAWITIYFDDNTTVPQPNAVLEDDQNSETGEYNFEVVDGEIRDKPSKNEKQIDSYESMDEQVQYGDENAVTIRKRDLMASIKKILVKYDIEDITMGDVYDGLIEIYGESIVGKSGISKSLIDTFTMRAVGQVEPPTEILKNMYLGTEYNASYKEELDELGVKLIVNVTEEVENFFPAHYRYHNISLKDVPSSDLKAHFHETIALIDQAREKGEGVFVHCQRGVSRSATIVLAYLMRTQGFSFEEALKDVVAKRPIVRPNEGFKQQLAEFGAELDEEAEFEVL